MYAYTLPPKFSFAGIFRGPLGSNLKKKVNKFSAQEIYLSIKPTRQKIGRFGLPDNYFSDFEYNLTYDHSINLTGVN